MILPTRGSEPATDPSRAGRDRGDVELGVGVITTGTAGALVGLGIFEAWKAAGTRRYCNDPAAFGDPEYDAFCVTPLGGDAFRAAVISSSLSFALSIPVAVAGGFLLRRGVQARRAWKRAEATRKLSLQPWSIGHHGGGLSLGVRF